MKHYKSVEFLSIFRMSSPPHKRKTPYWKLSGDGSAYQPWWFFVCSANKFDHTSHGVTAETENLHALLRHTQTYRTLHLSRFCLCGSTAVTYADNLRHVVEQAGVHNLFPIARRNTFTFVNYGQRSGQNIFNFLHYFCCASTRMFDRLSTKYPHT